MMKRILVLAVLALAGCSAKSDFEKICNAEQLSGAAGEKDPSEKAQKIAQYIQANIHSSAGKEFFQSIASVPGDKGPILKQAAHEAGYDGPCPMAEMK
jgi:hypothetical protein